ncbi:MAG: sorbosone dehydrogenase family protein [Solirubrobacteraceae bacterium]
MWLRSQGVVALLAAVTLVGCGSDESDPGPVPEPRPPVSAEPLADVAGRGAEITVRLLAGGFDRPTGLVQEPGRNGRILVLERPGTARWLDGPAPAAGPPFVDLTQVTASEDEQGLVGLAFLDGGRRVVIHRTDLEGSTDVSVYPVRDGRVDTTAGRRLLTVEQPYGNHNGGQIAIDPQGRVLVGIGDGGSAFDPRRNGQNLDTKLGKLLRWDPQHPQAGWKTVAYGLRNPWRLTFDEQTDELWIADAGRQVDKTVVEEIDRVAARELDEPEPLNFGWSALEGTRRLQGRDLNPKGRLVWPVASYGRHSGCLVIGGTVPRRSRLADLAGRYVFGDACTGRVWSVPAAGRIGSLRREPVIVPEQSGWLHDRSGRILVTDDNGLVSELVRGIPGRR